MKKVLKLGALVASVWTMSMVMACSSTTDEVKTHFDCNSVCKRYADCFNADYDVDGCRDKCENSAEDNQTRQNKLDACADCIDDKSCTAATFKCADECAGIVP